MPGVLYLLFLCVPQGQLSCCTRCGEVDDALVA